MEFTFFLCLCFSSNFSTRFALAFGRIPLVFAFVVAFALGGFLFALVFPFAFVLYLILPFAFAFAFGFVY